MVKPVAVLDACVIFPHVLCDSLLRMAENDMYRVCFSEKILDEAIRNRVKQGKMSENATGRFRREIIKSFPDALVEFPLELEALMGNDPKDRHVLAAAVYSKADLIVTSNLRDFPQASLEKWGNIKAVHPDMFLLSQCDEFGDISLYQLIQGQAAFLKRSFDRNNPDKIPPVTDLELLSVFEREQPKFASRMCMTGYGTKVASFCVRVREVMENLNCDSIDGDNYKIKCHNRDVEIIHKNSNRIFKCCDRGINGILKVEDIMRIETILKEIPILGQL
jgi:predicted nucleic acid-binding protein